MKMLKRGQMEFAWIFAVIVGALILFLAFYFVGTNLLSQKQQQATVQAQSLDILLNPFTQFGNIGATTANIIDLQQKSTIQFECEKIQGQGIGTNTITMMAKESVPRVVYDKYIFTASALEARKLQGISMPFNMPWRVADIIILWPYDKTYCFVSAPSSVKDKLGNETSTGLNISSLYFKTSSASCPENSTTVCFTGGCDILVNMQQGSTRKQSETVYFTGESLMYASIFSDKQIYECNVQRLASRLYSEASVYDERARALSSKGCTASYNLAALKQAATKVSSSASKENLQTLLQASQVIQNQNNVGDCSLY